MPADAPLPPVDPLDDPQREEARRQVTGSDLGDAAELTVDAADLLLGGTADLVVDATGAVLGATVEVAKVSLDVIGNMIGGLADL